MKKLNSQYWEKRYHDNKVGWDLGGCSAPLQNFFLSLKDKNIRILIPGCGNAHEAEYLHKRGFKNVYIADWASQPLANFKERVPSFPQEHVIHGDFFKLNKCYDLIIEQTFFCAIDPKLRAKYLKKCSEILNPDGLLAGVIFADIPKKDGPPYGGSIEEYHTLFEKNFIIERMVKCLTSEESRQGKELFVKFRKK